MLLTLEKKKKRWILVLLYHNSNKEDTCFDFVLRFQSLLLTIIVLWEILPPITYLWSENVRDPLYKACDNEGNESLKGFSVSRYNVMPIADDNCYWKDASAYPKNTAPHRHCFSMSASADQISMLTLFIVSMFAIERKWSSANSIQLSYLLALDKWIYSAPSYSFGFDIWLVR